MQKIVINKKKNKIRENTNVVEFEFILSSTVQILTYIVVQQPPRFSAHNNFKS